VKEEEDDVDPLIAAKWNMIENMFSSSSKTVEVKRSKANRKKK
jgi:hypothetical protein